MNNPELIDASNIHEYKAEVDKLGGEFNAQMMQYLPNANCGSRYIERLA